MLKLLNDPILTSLSWNQVKICSDRLSVFPVEACKTLESRWPLKWKKMKCNNKTVDDLKIEFHRLKISLLTRSPLGPFGPVRPLLPRHPWEKVKHEISRRIARSYKIYWFHALKKVRWKHSPSANGGRVSFRIRRYTWSCLLVFKPAPGTFFSQLLRFSPQNQHLI